MIQYYRFGELFEVKVFVAEHDLLLERFRDAAIGVSSLRSGIAVDDLDEGALPHLWVGVRREIIINEVHWSGLLA